MGQRFGRASIFFAWQIDSESVERKVRGHKEKHIRLGNRDTLSQDPATSPTEGMELGEPFFFLF